MTVAEKTQRGTLTPQQIAFYEAFGFLVLRQAFSSDQMKIIECDFEATMLEGEKQVIFDGSESLVVVNTIEHQSGFRPMMEDQINGRVEQLLGPDCVFISSDSHRYVGDTHWHPDMGWHPSMFGGEKPFPETSTLRGIKVAFYLDPVGNETGCLRVIPGSHILGVKDSEGPLNPFQDHLGNIHCDRGQNFSSDGEIKAFGIASRDVPAYALDSEPGDVVFFNHRTWHASFGGTTGRRMFALNYKAKPKTDSHRAFIKSTLEKRNEEEGKARYE